jgi:hypothetical protein
MIKHEEYTGALKSILIERVSSSAFVKIVAKVPFLAYGPWGYLFSLMLEKFITFLFNYTELGIILVYTDVRVGKQGKAFSKAIEKYINSQKGGSHEEKERTQKEVIKSFNTLISFTS